MIATKRLRTGSLAAVLLACGVSSAATGCSSATEEATGSDVGHYEEAAVDGMGPARFRDIFAAYASNRYPEIDIRKLVYMAGPDVESPDVRFSSAEEGLRAYDAHFAGIRPSSLFARGEATPFSPVENPDGIFDRSGPVTIVVVPGIFGEFIENTPFQELFDAGGSAAARFRDNLAAHAGAPEATDTAYSLDALGEREHSLDELVRVGSLDGADGKPLVNVVFLKPLLASLETVGTLDENAATYRRRLEKIFTVLGEPESYYLLGYSRGTTVALHMASQSVEHQGEAWARKLSGVITLGGVIYGTPLADVTRQEGHIMQRILARLHVLSDSLQECSPEDGVFGRSRKVASNSAAWITASAELGWLSTSMPSHPELAWESISSSTPDTGRMWKLITKILFSDAVRLDQPVSDYCGNVTRFRTMVREVQEGLDTLTTEDRVAWWQTHTLPAKMKFFSITGTMGDRTPGEGSAWAHVSNTIAYNPGSIDFKSLRGNFYDLVDSGGVELNDSQVAVQRGRFWPRLMPVMNPAQARVNTYFMGVLGEHHWGFAFPEAVAMRESNKNPFPRTTLMRAMGAFVAEAEVKARR